MNHPVNPDGSRKMAIRNRGVSPVLGVFLAVVVTLLIASFISFHLTAVGSGLDNKQAQFEDSVSTLSGNPWSGEKGDLFRVSNNRAGATDVKYRVNFTIENGSPTVGNKLNHIVLEVNTGSPDMFSNTDRADLITAGVDEDSDGTIDQDLSNYVDQWEVMNGGTSVKINFPGSGYTASANDSIIIVFDGVDNPGTPGDYELRAETNNDGNWHNGTVTIVE